MLSEEDLKFKKKLESTIDFFIEKETNPSIEETSKKMCLSTSTLRRKIHNLSSKSFRDICNEKRLKYACSLLSKGHTVKSVSQKLGYSDSSPFVKWFKAQTQTTPMEYKLSLDSIS